MVGIDGHSMGNTKATNNSLQPSLKVLKMWKVAIHASKHSANGSAVSYGLKIRSETTIVNQHEMYTIQKWGFQILHKKSQCLVCKLHINNLRYLWKIVLCIRTTGRKSWLKTFFVHKNDALVPGDYWRGPRILPHIPTGSWRFGSEFRNRK